MGRRLTIRSKTSKKKSIETFDSKLDVTAIAGVEASEMSDVEGKKKEKI